MPDLLIELFSEEIPARMQARAAEDLRKLVGEGLTEAGLSFEGAEAFATPRRLALSVTGLLAESPAQVEERKGPKADAPEKAIEGFLRSTGLSRGDLEERETPKGAVLFARIERPGRAAEEIVAEVLARTVRGFPWPKSMRWGAGSLRWVRPLRSILCILSEGGAARVVPMEVDGFEAGDTTFGHRFLAPDAIQVTGFADYEAKLAAAHVTLRGEARAEAIWRDATAMAEAEGLEVVEDRGLLAEVAGLVECPVVLMGPIGADFLGLPPEVLQTSMKEHQKFFSVRNPATGRIEKFITVANRPTADNGATILAGNEKVLAARLADAKFFWENDLRVATSDTGMSAWVKSLENVTFHNKLGSQAELIERMALLARELAPMVGADADLAEQAARVAKADLSSEMVYEFPELQGLMGRYYAEAAGLPADVAAACEDHYAPLGPSDDVPTAPVSVAVALAEKIDKLCGFWAIDEKPTGSKDPFALRRAALGVIRILVEKEQSIGVLPVLMGAVQKQPTEAMKLVASVEILAKLRPSGNPGKDRVARIVFDQLKALALPESDGDLVEFSALTSLAMLSFIHDRLKVYLRDQGIRHDIIDACIAMEGNDDLTLLVKRATALNDTLKTDDGENLIQGFKRANNILTQAEEADGVEYSYGADVKYAETQAERDLFAALDAADAAIKPAMAGQDFPAAMAALAALRGPIDAFFEAVMINTDNATVRRNRLNLLHRIRSTCTAVADLTRVEG